MTRTDGDNQVYAISEQLDIPRLKDLARMQFDDCLDEKLELKELTDVIELVYSTTSESDQALRSIVVKTAAARSTELLRDKDFTDMLRRVGDFTMDLALRLAPKPMKIGLPRCGVCEHHVHSADRCYELHPELRPYRRSYAQRS